MCDQTSVVSTQSIADYLAQLLKDRKQLAAFPSVFLHVERLIDEGKSTLKFISGSRNLSTTLSCFIIYQWSNKLVDKEII